MMLQPAQQTNSDSVPCVVSIPCVQMLLLAGDAQQTSSDLIVLFIRILRLKRLTFKIKKDFDV